MGRITVFALDDCPHCKRAKKLLDDKGVQYNCISLTSEPGWRNLLFVLSNGRTSVPQIFLNKEHIGGADELFHLEEEGKLQGVLQRALAEESTDDFPPTLHHPTGEEFLQVIPEELRRKWQAKVEALDARLGGVPDKPISSLLLMLEAPEEMVVVCTAGPGKAIYKVGEAGNKGDQGSKEKLYCQVAIERQQTLFIDDPSKFPGLEKNEDWVKFGYGYYVGAPWVVGQTKGTIVAMEKQSGILKEEHIKIIEEIRDSIEADLHQWRESH